LLQAWDLAAQKPGSCILWIHAPQPVLLSSPDVLRQAYERRRHGPRLFDYQTAPGPNRILDALDGVSALEALPRGAETGADLRRLFTSWQAGRKQLRLNFERLEAEPDSSPAIRKASAHLARLWAVEQVRWLQASRRVPEAIDLAAALQLVTAVSGAVVLETAEQYARHGLTPADPMSVPAIPEPGVRSLLLVGLVMLLLRRRTVPRA
jgi:hypothetical protein